jgi:hypothetical protein
VSALDRAGCRLSGRGRVTHSCRGEKKIVEVNGNNLNVEVIGPDGAPVLIAHHEKSDRSSTGSSCSRR